MTEKRTPKSLILTLLFLVLLVVGGVAFYKLYEREKPQVNFTGDISNFGLEKKISFVVTDSRSGIQSIDMMLVQGKDKARIFSRQFIRQGYAVPGPKRIEETITVDTGPTAFQDGSAELVVTVHDFSFSNWLAGNKTVMKYPVTMDTKPPKISILHSTRYVSNGGSGMIVYKISEEVEEHGVYVNGHYNPGFPLDESDEGRYVAFFGLSYDIENISGSHVKATDKAGNIGKSSFGIVLKKQNFTHDTINVSDNFLNNKIPEFSQVYPQLSGSLVEQYIYVNGKIREENYQTIVKACSDPNPKRLWLGRFERMGRSSRKASFADHRTYFYKGNEIDKQVHLGIDLASTRRAPVKAANRGKVVFADYLGIYGNTVILDHGQGIYSLYSHLSEIKVEQDGTIEKGIVLGLSGTSGMAGGDHLHFSILVNGIFVNPVEWWDQQWISLNIDEILFSRKSLNRPF
jgi:murein DD-endopeptidase MepM/ murein hydrolase activator NlpD